MFTTWWSVAGCVGVLNGDCVSITPDLCTHALSNTSTIMLLWAAAASNAAVYHCIKHSDRSLMLRQLRFIDCTCQSTVTGKEKRIVQHDDADCITTSIACQYIACLAVSPLRRSCSQYQTMKRSALCIVSIDVVQVP